MTHTSRDAAFGLTKHADLEVDALHQTVLQSGRSLRLTPHEHVLLYMLMCQPGVAVTHSQLAASVGSLVKVPSNTIARHISVLRRKLGDHHAHPRYIETLDGVGYRFIAAPVE